MLQGKIRWLCLHSMEAPGEQNTGGRHLRCGTAMHIVMYRPWPDQRPAPLVTPSLAPLDESRAAIFLCFSVLRSLQVSLHSNFLWKRCLNKCLNNRGVVTRLLRLPAFTDSRFKTKIGNPLPSRYIHFHFSPTKHLQIIRGEDKATHSERWMA